MTRRTYLSATTSAVSVLGLHLAAERRAQRRTALEVAERAGMTRVTLRNIERGDPNVAIGSYFEVATVLSVPLFGADGARLADLVARGEMELALLPRRVRARVVDIDDDF